MQPPDFAVYPIGVNLLLFASAACLVWAAGARVASYADQIARATGIGHAIVGLVLLGGVTSLPEIAVGVFAAYAGSPALAVNNLLGGIAMQKAILAGVDGFIGKAALTVIAASPNLLLQAAFGTLLLVLVAAAIVVGDFPFAGAGVWTWSILLAYCFSVWKIAHSSKRPAWIVCDTGGARAETTESSETEAALPRLQHNIVKTLGAAAIIFIAGFFLSSTADVLAAQTGLGKNFVGAVLLGLATSLPELSTVTAAMRMRQYEMAIADILGTSMFNVMLLFLIDVIYRGPPVLSLAGDFSLLTVLLCILMATIYLIGLVERNNQTFARFGVDSLTILVCYIGGLFLLFQLR